MTLRLAEGVELEVIDPDGNDRFENLGASYSLDRVSRALREDICLAIAYFRSYEYNEMIRAAISDEIMSQIEKSISKYGYLLGNSTINPKHAKAILQKRLTPEEIEEIRGRNNDIQWSTRPLAIGKWFVNGSECIPHLDSINAHKQILYSNGRTTPSAVTSLLHGIEVIYAVATELDFVLEKTPDYIRQFRGEPINVTATCKEILDNEKEQPGWIYTQEGKKKVGEVTLRIVTLLDAQGKSIPLRDRRMVRPLARRMQDSLVEKGGLHEVPMQDRTTYFGSNELLHFQRVLNSFFLGGRVDNGILEI